MPSTSRFLTALRRVGASITAGLRGSRASRVAAPEALPGQSGDAATVELDPRNVRHVRLAYEPKRDADPDPGEVVWTWVPYEERDGRGKDRPVAIVAADGRGDFLAIQLTSQAHDADRDYLALGVGDWDGQGRPSWARLDRLFRVRTAGMRREAAALDAARYAALAAALRQRYGWE